MSEAAKYAQRYAQMRAALERIATFRGEYDLPERLRNGSPAAIRYYVATEPIRIAREVLAVINEQL